MKSGILLGVAISLSLGSWAAAQDRVKYGIPIKTSPLYVLPLLAAEDQGIWKKSNLQVEWPPFRAAGDMYRAVAAGEVQVGMSEIVTLLLSASRGLPLLLVSDTGALDSFHFFVPVASRIKGVQDLAGTKWGVPRFGGGAHAFGQLASIALGLEGKMKLVAAGGVMEALAAAKAGAMDGNISTFFSMAPLLARKEIREVLNTRDYLPGGWSDGWLFARRDFIEERTEVARRVVKAVFEAFQFILKNEAWSVTKMKEAFGQDEATAKLVFSRLRYADLAALDPSKVRDAIALVVKYKLIRADEAPPVERLYSARLLP